MHAAATAIFTTALVFSSALLLAPQSAYAAFTSTETIFGVISTGTHTWTNADIGAANPNRKIVVFIIINENGSAHAADGAPSAVTIGGVSAVKVADNSFPNSPSSNNQSVTVWTAAVPTGTTADIVASGIPTSLYNGGIAVLATTDEINISRVYDVADIDQDTNGGSMDVDVPVGGLVAGAGVTWPDLSGHTWTGLTELDEVTDGGDNYWSVAAYAATAPQSPLSVSVSYSADVSNFVTVSFAPSQISLSRPPNNLGLVGYWPMDEGTGSVVGDHSGFGNHGTLGSFDTDLPTWTNGRFGKGLHFSGTAHGPHVATTFNQTLLPATFIAWMKVSTGDLQACDGLVFSRGTDVSGINISDCISGTRVGYHWNDNEFDWVDGPLVPLDTWALVAVVVESGQATAYVFSPDGTASAVNTTTHTASIIDDVKFGVDEGGGGRYFAGEIDDVRIYNRALTEAEISRLYNAGAVRISASSVDLDAGSSLEQGLVGHWTMDGKDTLSTITDRSGNGFHGYLRGGATSSAKTIGVLGQAFRFDGIDDFVAITSTGSVSGTFSVSAWANPNTIACDGSGIIFGSRGDPGQSFDMKFSCGNQIHGDIGNGTDWITTLADASYSYTAGNWYHIVYVVTPTSYTIYANGNQIGTDTFSTDDPLLYDEFHTMAIGAERADSPAEFMNGRIDDVRAYNRALTAAEVKQLYNLGQVKITQ